LTTAEAIDNIEKRFLRTDLNDKEKEDYDWLKSWILGNLRRSNICRMNAWFGGVALAALLLINNILILRIRRNKSKEKTIQPGASQDAQKDARP
jgi:hypothetical protein